MPKRDTKLVALLACSLGAYLAMNLLYFPLSVPWMLQHSGGVPPLDMVPHRDILKTYDIVDGLRASGRRNHILFIWTIDLVLPLLFGWSLYAAIDAGAKRAFEGSRSASLWRWFAVAAVTCDYLENICNTILLANYPARFPTLASLSGPLTMTKFILYGASVLLTIWMFSVALLKGHIQRWQ